MWAHIYSMGLGVYPAPMAPARSPNLKYGVSITAREATVLEEARRRRHARYLSAVMDAALRELLAGEPFGERPLEVPSAAGEEMVAKKFQLPPATIRAVKDTARLHRFTEQHIVRAAIYRLERAAAGAQGPTQTGR